MPALEPPPQPFYISFEQIEHDGHPHGPEERRRNPLQQSFAKRHVRPTYEDRRVVQLLDSAREDGTVHKIAHLVGRNAAVTKDRLGTGIGGDDAVEHAGLRIRVELNQDSPLSFRFSFGHGCMFSFRFTRHLF